MIDADALAREVTDLPAVREAIFEHFGPELRRADGTLDRAALGRRVFADPAQLAVLEGLTHPRVRERIVAELARAKAAGVEAVIVEAIKLIESGLASACDEVWLVTCEPEEQRARLEARGLSAADAEQRMAAQGNLFVRLGPQASRVISTSGSPEDAEGRVERAYRMALADHGERDSV